MESTQPNDVNKSNPLDGLFKTINGIFNIGNSKDNPLNGLFKFINGIFDFNNKNNPLHGLFSIIKTVVKCINFFVKIVKGILSIFR